MGSASNPETGRHGRAGDAAMVRPRISIAGMMIVLVALALVLSSLRFPSEGAAAAVLLVTQAVLAVAILAVVYRTQERRAFWLGFALFGWGYMALTWESWCGYGANRPEMLTSMALHQLEYYFRHPPGQHAGFWSFLRPVGGDDKTKRILEKLDEPISMSFNEETPLEDVLKYIKAATASATSGGIPIYVDPIGLSEADKTMASTVRNMELEGVPLRRTLSLLLNQLGLDYVVDEGMLKISVASTLSNSGPFRRMGHCYWALLAAFCGGFAGRVLQRGSHRVSAPDSS
jgi:hypothetical protein